MPTPGLDAAAGGAFVLILQGIAKVIKTVRGDGDKIIDAEVESKKINVETKKVEITADEQEFKQQQEVINVLKDLLKRADERANTVETKFENRLESLVKQVGDLGKELNESEVKYAVLQAEHKFMETRVSVLENQLQIATSQNKEYAIRIEALETENAALREESESHEAKTIELLNLLRDANSLLDGRSLPKVPMPSFAQGLE